MSIQELVREPYIVSCFNKNTYIIAFKNIMNMITFFFHRRQKVSKLGKKPDFIYFYYYSYYYYYYYYYYFTS